MAGMLASVATLDEARLALRLGADILDLKNPAAGALGAWQPEALGQAARELAGSAPLSATIGDLPLDPPVVRRAVLATAATGVDIVKIGFFAGGGTRACIEALASTGVPRVAVMMADQGPDITLLDHLAAGGFLGAMLDTADKRAGGLLDHLDQPFLAAFVARARSLGLLTGLAGSLALADIARLLPLGADYLGFRGALCGTAGRAGRLDPDAFAGVRAAIPASPLDLAPRLRRQAPATA